jgi:hypothetical protein
MGDEVTIAIVALTAPYAHFVSVSDQMVSHDDILPANESALIKSLQIGWNWSIAYSANKIENVLPLLDRVRDKIFNPKQEPTADELQQHFATSIAEMIQVDFFNRRLARYGYRDIEQFRSQGQSELGAHFFELCRELDSADLGVECIVYGYEHDGNVQRLFEVTGKGEIIDRMAIRYAVVGSGYWMASASLKRKPLSLDFDSMVYRLLEAKFSAETASGVGKRTTVIFTRPRQHNFKMWPGQIEKIRAIWEAQMRFPEPAQSAEIVGKIRIEMMEDDKQRAEFMKSQQQQASTGTGS